MAVDAVMLLDELLPMDMIGIKKVTGGNMEVCRMNHTVNRSSMNGLVKAVLFTGVDPRLWSGLQESLLVRWISDAAQALQESIYSHVER